MGQRALDRRRAKISVTVDRDLLHSVDAYIEQHSQADRSKIIDEALWLWYAREQTRAMEEQFKAEPSQEELEEREAWRRIQAAAAERIFNGPARG
jgi:hypothetical protein